MCKKNSTDLIKIIIHVLLAVVFVLNFKIIRVNGQSMSPTLDNGQVILTSRHTDDLKRNSIVIVKYNDELTSLSAIAKDIKGYPVSGPMLFKYNDKLVTEIAEETQWKE